ncbi:protein phosphatase 2C domain-containing protein [Streptomyces sp. NPDC127117]|uniref:protein phosphatase 2C domain-containing protein n=1 Tax=Streptomyces sp. NPDC127117 TaxID=3345368 RepID=UPI00362B5A10
MTRFRTALAVDNKGMSQQGEKPAANEDDWWRRLYDESARDTGTSDAADSLDDRFDSASDAVSPGGAGAGGRGRTSGRGFDEGPGGGAASGTGARAYGGSDGGAGEPSAVMPEADPVVAPGVVPVVDPVVGSRPVWGETVRERAPWEPPVATVGGPGTAPSGPAQPRTFAAPPIPAEPPPPSVSPSVPLSVPPSASPPVPPSVPEPVPEPTRAVEQLTTAPAAAERLAPEQQATPPPLSAPPLPRRPVAERPAAPPAPAAAYTAPAASTAPAPEAGREAGPASRPVIGHVGDRPPTYDPEPTALPATAPQELDGLVADTVLDGARYGTYTLRAVSVRGDSARFRGEPRRDALLTARFGTDERALVLVAVATGARAAGSAHLAAADACRWIGAAVGRSHVRLSEDIRAGRRGDLKSGLNRLTDRTYGKLRARAAELGVAPQQYTAGLRCLLLPADPDCRTRVFFGIGAGGLFRLRDGVWHDLEPEIPAVGDTGGAGDAGDSATDPRTGPGAPSSEGGPDGDHLTMDLAITTPSGPYAESPPDPPAEPFRFRGSVARQGDALLLCSPGLAEPLRGEPALAEELAGRWATEEAPGLVAFLADTQLRVKGYSDDRTSVGVWEA